VTNLEVVDFTKLTYTPDWRKFDSVTPSVASNTKNYANGKKAWSNVTRIKFNFTPTMVDHLTLFTGTNGSIKVHKEGGYIYDTNDPSVKLFEGLKVGTKSVVTLNLAAPRSYGVFGTADGQGDCWRGIIENLEITTQA
jgi:hypothetical protein